jgi:long-chain fatty acid transport protein
LDKQNHGRSLHYPGPPFSINVIQYAFVGNSSFEGANMISAVSVFCLALAPLAATGLVQDQTARATGVAGAYTAQVDDPTAVFFNPGALGLLSKKKGLSAGAASSSYRPFHYQGRAPGIGAGTVGEQTTSIDIAPSLFATMPFNDRIVLGGGAYASMRTRSDWESPDEFSGRYLATQSSIDAYDVVTAAGVQLTPSLGIGAGAVYRSAKLTLDRRIGTPINDVMRDIASVSIETDMKSTLGWSAGLLLRPSPRFSFGVSYRSPINIGFEGVGVLTQIPTGNAQIDQLTAELYPFDQNLAIVSELETPGQFNAGIAFAIAEPLLFEVDVNRTQWTAQSLAVAFPNDRNLGLEITYPLAFEATMDYRAGVRFQLPTGPILRAGFAIEKSPQPAAALTPFLASLDRNTATVGFGLDWLDVAVAWTAFGKKSVTTSAAGFNGDYSGNEWTLVVTATK